jgi:hypothetical protein
MKSLSDVVGGAGLSGYAEVALILFLAVFVAVVLRVMFSNRRHLDAMARLPLDGDTTSHSSGPGGTP